MKSTDTLEIVSQCADLLTRVLSLEGREHALSTDTRLLGAVAELDSASALSILTALEETFSITIHDDEIDAALFETVGSLADFVEKKIRCLRAG